MASIKKFNLRSDLISVLSKKSTLKANHSGSRQQLNLWASPKMAANSQIVTGFTMPMTPAPSSSSSSSTSSSLCMVKKPLTTSFFNGGGTFFITLLGYSYSLSFFGIYFFSFIFFLMFSFHSVWLLRK